MLKSNKQQTPTKYTPLCIPDIMITRRNSLTFSPLRTHIFTQICYTHIIYVRYFSLKMYEYHKSALQAYKLQEHGEEVNTKSY